MQIHSPACFSFVFRFSNYGSSPEELNHALLTSGWREGLGVRRSCSVLLGVALARREAFWHVILCQKPSHLSQEKSLSFLCFFFFFLFQDSWYFQSEMLCIQTKVVPQKKKKIVLKAIAQINSDHWGIPAYVFSSFFFFFFKFCPRYLLSCYFLQPLMFIPPDFSSSCVLYSSMSTCVNKRQKVLETVGDHPHVSSLPCIALVLCGVQARSEPHTTNCYVPVVMLCPGRCVQKPSESSGKEREVENKKKLSRVCLVI